MNNYFQTKNKEHCNGCGVCSLICPQKCIKMIEDDEGFLYPNIDKDKCINCKKCEKICTNYNDAPFYPLVYAAKSKDKDVLKNSTSGGIYSLLAQYIIEKKGVVCGAELTKELVVKHDFAETLEEMKKFRDSKYVRSDLTGIYEEIESFLKQGRYVLFTGTPCQCNGLKKYLQKEYETLIICDIICHANPSPKVFDTYKKQLENKYGKKIRKIVFRSKKNGWHGQTMRIQLENSRWIKNDTFYYAFTSELINRPSCYQCPFSSTNRVTDITIGDFWGIGKVFPEMDKNDGVSLLAINSDKGKQIFNQIKENLIYKECDKEKAFSYNRKKELKPNKNREKFFEELKQENRDCIALMEKYSGISKKHKRKMKVKNTLLKIVPPNIKIKIKQLHKK